MFRKHLNIAHDRDSFWIFPSNMYELLNIIPVRAHILCRTKIIPSKKYHLFENTFPDILSCVEKDRYFCCCCCLHICFSNTNISTYYHRLGAKKYK